MPLMKLALLKHADHEQGGLKTRPHGVVTATSGSLSSEKLEISVQAEIAEQLTWFNVTAPATPSANAAYVFNV